VTLVLSRTPDDHTYNARSLAQERDDAEHEEQLTGGENLRSG
jgi:hypothetical protein